MSARVSVIIPTYNRASAVCEAIGSVLDQTYGDLEVLVVDDGSTDGTAGIVAETFGPDPRVKVLSRPNGGPAAARNHGIRQARGELIAFLDSDDLWEPDKLELQVAQLDAEPDVALSFTDRISQDAPGGRTRFRETGFDGRTGIASLVAGNIPISTPCVVVRRAVLESVGLFDETFTCAEDWDLWLRVLSRHRVAAIDRPLTLIRRRDDSISRTRLMEKWRSWLRLWEKHEALLLEAGCSASLVRRKKAHAHKKIAQTAHAAGDRRLAARHYLAWWRLQPWQVRGLAWGALLKAIAS